MGVLTMCVNMPRSPPGRRPVGISVHHKNEYEGGVKAMTENSLFKKGHSQRSNNSMGTQLIGHRQGIGTPPYRAND